MEKIKKLKILKIANYTFIIYCIFLIGNIIFVRPKEDNAFKTNFIILEILSAMPIEQLILIVGMSVINMILCILAIIKSTEEKVISKEIIKYLIIFVITVVILCVSSIYVYHKYNFIEIVTRQTQLCVDELKNKAINSSQIHINKIKTSADNKRKYRYITIDYSTNSQRKIVIYKLENKENKILKQYETNNIEYVRSSKGFFAIDDELDIDIQNIK